MATPSASCVAGVFNRLTTEIEGRVVENESLVNAPNWLPLTFRPAGGEWFDLRRVTLLEYRQELNVQRGVLTRIVRFADSQDWQTRLIQRRFVHMQDPHLAGLQTTIVAENWSGRLEVRSSLDGRVVNGGVARYRRLDNQHLVPREARAIDGEAVLLVVETNQSHVRIAGAARTRVLRDGSHVNVERRLVEAQGYVGHEFTVDVREGQGMTIDKVVSLYTSRDHAIFHRNVARGLSASADREMSPFQRNACVRSA